MSDDTVNHRSDGRFQLGNKAALGNPNNRRMQELRKSLLDAATPEQVAAVIAKLGEQAAAGDVPSAKVFLDHTCGRPIQAVALSGPDGSALGVDLVRVRVAILAALGDEPIARYKVARALLSIGSEAGGDVDGPGDDAGD